MNTTRTIQEIEKEIAELEQQLDAIPAKRSFVSSDDDDYQEQLELSYEDPSDEINERLTFLHIEAGQAYTQEANEMSHDSYLQAEAEEQELIYDNKGKAIRAIFIKSYPHGKLMFAQERLAFVDYDNILINSLDIIPFLEESNALKYEDMKNENDLNTLENQTNEQ